ncbi:hypothetical protein [Pseudoalteromonas sp.]|uniref:hypothetical protein n=1 Tax=Pseudoalteromonas sp. TaxID=53249 RepID=UPI0023526790|nr:hypothetical protein [Pseudoalteromonas sp.]
MNQDFEIEILATSGLSTLGKLLDKCPIALDLEVANSGDIVLKQNTVSQIAGFEFESKQSDVYIFSLYINHRSIEPAKTIVLQFSEFLKAASLPHRITEILHNVDFDENWVSYQWPTNT